MYTILAVDDAKDTLMLLEFDLEEEGYQVFTAESGEAALTVLKTSKVDLILLDMYMPGISGLSLLQKIKSEEQDGNMPVIMLSASDDEDQIVAALEFGADDYVTKPYIAKVLLARIRTSLRLKEKTRELENLAKNDFLTGINNRGSFEELTNKAISFSHRVEQELVIAMLDIDFFKNVNDTYGHEIGDKVLIQFASIMSESFREYDIIGRIGGEEFAVCMPNCSIEDAMQACDRFRISIEEHKVRLNEHKEKYISVTVSIGLAAEKGESINLEALLRQADQGLYIAKESGRNKVINTENDSQAHSEESENLEGVINPMDNKIDDTNVKFPGIDYDIGVGNVLGDDSLFEEILLMFYEDHAKDADKLQTAIKEQNTDSLKHIAHTLKGVACSVGAMSLFDVTKSLDLAINEQKKDKFEELFTPVKTELEKVIKGIEQVLASRF